MNSDAVRLICGDALDVLSTIDDDSIDLVVTDIPYGEVNRKSNGLRNLDKGVADVVNFDIDELIRQLVRVCRGSIYIFAGTEQVSQIRRGLAGARLTTRVGVWSKSNPSPINGSKVWLSSIELFVYGKKPRATFNEHCRGTVFQYPTVRSKLHPTAKPVPLMRELIEASSNPDDVVLDCMMGSGTTGVAALELDRRFIGIEIDKEFFRIAEERLNRVQEELVSNIAVSV